MIAHLHLVSLELRRTQMTKVPPVREWENKKCTGGCAVKVSVVVVVSGAGGCV